MMGAGVATSPHCPKSARQVWVRQASRPSGGLAPSGDPVGNLFFRHRGQARVRRDDRVLGVASASTTAFRSLPGHWHDVRTAVRRIAPACLAPAPASALVSAFGPCEARLDNPVCSAPVQEGPWLCRASVDRLLPPFPPLSGFRPCRLRSFRTLVLRCPPPLPSAGALASPRHIHFGYVAVETCPSVSERPFRPRTEGLMLFESPQAKSACG